MFTKTFGIAAAFAAVASALPNGLANKVRRDDVATGGSVLITNNLNVDVYAWSVTDVSGPMLVLPANGGVYTEAWKLNPNGGGVSIKLSTDPNQQDVLQFEYTQAVDTIFWDLSCINMGSDSQFTKYGFAVQPTDATSSCPSAICAAGDTACSDAYLLPYDDWATHGCPINTGLSLTIGQ